MLIGKTEKYHFGINKFMNMKKYFAKIIYDMNGTMLVWSEIIEIGDEIKLSSLTIISRVLLKKGEENPEIFSETWGSNDPECWLLENFNEI